LTKRALLSYLTRPFSLARDDPRFLSHINIWHAVEMVRALNKLGYRVDVVGYQDLRFVPRRPYDLFIGHGGTNYERIARRLEPGTVKIYFSSGCYWRFHNEQELLRLEALRARRGMELPPDRLIQHSEEGALKAADAILGLGNGFTRSTYADFSRVIMLNGTALDDDHFEGENKDYGSGRGHFLFFAGPGNVHKGLDLLLEAFSGLEKHLWICTLIDPPFGAAYRHELQELPNVHLVGWTELRSLEYYKLVDRCDFAVLPSCSEGQAQSVVECMSQGLIPMVSRASGLDVEGFGFLLEPCTVEEIVHKVQEVAGYSAEHCRELSLRTREVARARFSEQVFPAEFKRAVQIVVARAHGARALGSSMEDGAEPEGTQHVDQH
jgi:glycosyltransferase involved in cell wall biosynthesis